MLRKYRVRVTRNVTESTDIVVEAWDKEDANYKALMLVREAPGEVDWEADDIPWNSEPYIADEDFTEPVEVK